MATLSRAAQKAWAHGVEMQMDEDGAVVDTEAAAGSASSSDAAAGGPTATTTTARSGALAYSSAVPLQAQLFQFAATHAAAGDHDGGRRGSRPLSAHTIKPLLQGSRPSATATALLGASHSRPSTAGRTPLTASLGAGGTASSGPSFRPAATGPAAEALGLAIQSSHGVDGPSRPPSGSSSSSARRGPPFASASGSSATPRPRPTLPFQPTNAYAQALAPAYATDEKDASSSAVAAAGAAASSTYRGFIPSRPSSGASTARAASRSSSRPTSGYSTARRSRPPSAVANLAFGSVAPSAAHAHTARPSSSARGRAAAHLIDCYDPQALVTIDSSSTASMDFDDHRRHQRADGLLLTTRARPPFHARAGGDAHSSLPLSAAALRPNAGFHAELGVAHERLHRFQVECAAERLHFYSQNLFLEYKLAELLRATEEEQAASAGGKEIARTTTAATVGTEREGGSGDERSRQQQQQRKGVHQQVPPVSDAVYPSTYRTLCASAILKQVVPSLTVQQQPQQQTTMRGNQAFTGHRAAGSSHPAPHPPPPPPAPGSSTQALLSLTLDILHRSIYQPAAASSLLALPSANSMERQEEEEVPGDEAEGEGGAEEDDDEYGGGGGGGEGDSSSDAPRPPTSARVRRLQAVKGSGYAQATTRHATHLLEAAEDTDDARRRHPAPSFPVFASAVGAGDGDGGSGGGGGSSGSFSIPFFLTTRYLYESTQVALAAARAREDKLARVDRQIARVESTTTRRVCRVAFHIWRAHVRLQKQKANLSVFLTGKGRARRCKAEPELIFQMWKSWARRSKMKRAFRHQLRAMAGEIRLVSAGLHDEGLQDSVRLRAHLDQIQDSFAALAAESTYSSTPIDLFSPVVLTLLAQRLMGQLALVASHPWVDLLPLCPTYAKSADLSIEVDLLLAEIGRLNQPVGGSGGGGGSSALSDVRQHLLAKVESVERRSGHQEQGLMESLLYLSGEDFLFAWANAHLAAVPSGASISSGLKLEDLAELPRDLDIWLGLLRSVAPAVVDAVMANLRLDTTFGGGAYSANASFASSSSSSSSYGPPDPLLLGFGPATSKSVLDDSHTVGRARCVLEVCATLGCLPVVTLEEFLAHPAHASVLARLREAKEKSGRAGPGAEMSHKYASSSSSSSSTVAASGSSFDPSSYFSSHPGDAGLTASELGLPVDAHDRMRVEKKHMFDGLQQDAAAAGGNAGDSTSAGNSAGGGGAAGETAAEKGGQRVTFAGSPINSAGGFPAGGGGGGGGPPVRYSQVHDPSIRAQPHLHLSLLAALFLQRPNLPLTSSSAGATAASSSQQEHWLRATEAKVKGLLSQWEALKGPDAHGGGSGGGGVGADPTSFASVAGFLSGVQHVGLEIDIMLARARRRAHACQQVRDKMEDLLWTLQKRKGTSAGGAGGGGGAGGDGQNSGGDSFAASSSSPSSSSSSSVRRAHLKGSSPEYSEIGMGRLLDLLQPEADPHGLSHARSLREYTDLKVLLGKHYPALASIFRHYSTLDPNHANSSGGGGGGGGADGGSLRFSEFLTLAIDCRLVSARLPKAQLQVAFTRAGQSLRDLQAHSLHALPNTDRDRLDVSHLARVKPRGRVEEIAAVTQPTPTKNTTAATEPDGEGTAGVCDEEVDEPDEADDFASSSSSPSHDEPVLSQAGLFECLIRIGAWKYAGVSHLVERVRRLLEMDVLPNARRLQLDAFRSVLNRERVRMVFLAHRTELQAIFHHFAKEETTTTTTATAAAAAAAHQQQLQKEHLSTPRSLLLQSSAGHRAGAGGPGGRAAMTRASFVRLAYEAKLIGTNPTAVASTTASTTTAAGVDGASSSSSSSSSSLVGGLPLSESQLTSLLSRVVRLGDPQPQSAASSRVGALVDFDLSYGEFLEALGAIAAWKQPDPYLPIQVKLERFVSHVLLPPLRKTVRRLNQLLAAAQHAQQQRADTTTTNTPRATAARTQINPTTTMTRT